MTAFSGRLKALRKSRQISQQALADMIGISKSSINMYERGEREPGFETLETIADHFNVDMDFLLGKSEHPNKSAWLMSGANRILSRRESLGYSFQDLAKKTGISEASLMLWEREPFGVGKNISRAQFRVLCEALELDADAMPGFPNPFGDEVAQPTLAGRSIAFAYDKATPAAKKMVEMVLEISTDVPLTEAVKRTIEFPVFDQPAAAGFGNYLDDTAYEVLSFPQNQVPAGADFGVRISGDSMEPEIEDESIVFVEERLAIDSGQIGIFILNGDAYCKKLILDYTRSGQRRVRLVSLNPEYDDIDISEDDDLRTVGRVLGMAAMRTAD